MTLISMTKSLKLLAIVTLITLSLFTTASAQVYRANRSFEEDENLPDYDSIKYAKVIKMWQRSALKGNKLAQYIVGSYYYNGEGVEKDFQEAIKWFSLAANKGLAQAQFSLGLCYYNGEGTEKNVAGAVKWWQISARKGCGEAQYYLGLCYYEGNGVEKDLKKARIGIVCLQTMAITMLLTLQKPMALI